ncbi:MAG: hypothetical protein KDI45_09815 [Candidatus Accumulibacter sp.]|nr:hypothetical protein [Accumulibacter sp.]
MANADNITSHGDIRRFEPVQANALAIAGLVLLAAVNEGDLVVNHRAEPARGDRMRKLLDQLYLLQDQIHGSPRNLPAVLAAVCNASIGRA